MRRERPPTYLPLALSLALLSVACATSRELVPEAAAQRGENAPRESLPESADVGEAPTSRTSVAPRQQRPAASASTQVRLLPLGLRELPEGRWQLLFPPRQPSRSLEVMSVEQVRPLLDALSSLEPRLGPRLRLVEVPGAAPSSPGPTSPWESRLREEFLSRIGPALLPLPESLASSRLFLALQLSTRYMGDGIREAAIALFTSPAFVISVSLSVIVYFAAWLAPEPLFSKALAATLTLRLSLAVGLVELGQVAQACLRLYREAEAASTPEELEAASARFGRSMGGTSLRVLVTVASLGLARLIPNDPAPVRGIKFRRPDASSVRPDGVRHNTNYVSNSRDLKRELEAFDSMVRADPRAIHELYMLDGTLVRRHVPSGVSHP